MPLAPAHRRAIRRAYGLALGLLLALAPTAARAQGPTTPSASAPAGPPVMIPWLSPATSQPLVMTFKHDFHYDPRLRKAEVRRSQWRVRQLRLDLFGGRLTVEGSGEIGGGGPPDVATTVTLSHVDFHAMLEFLQIPRADEVEGRVNGRLGARVTNGDWASLRVRVSTEPGTVRLSRGLVLELLGASYDPKTMNERVLPVINATYGDAQMLAVESLTIEGDLDKAELQLDIPIELTNIGIHIEPRVDRSLLWEAWNYLKNAGLRDVQGVDITRLR